MYKSVKKVKTTPFGHRFSVSEYQVELFNGNKGQFFIRESSPYSIIIPILDKKRIVMISQPRFAANKISLEFPMGQVIGKKPKEIALQELKEETGYLAKRITPFFSFNLSPGWSTQTGHIFIAEQLVKGNPQLEETEEIKVEIVLEKHIDNLIKKGIIFDASTILAYLLYKKLFTPRAIR